MEGAAAALDANGAGKEGFEAGPGWRILPGLRDGLPRAYRGELLLESSGARGSTFTVTVTVPRAGLALPDN